MRPPSAKAVRPACRLKMCAPPKCALSDAGMKCCRKHREGCWRRERSPVGSAFHGFEQLRDAVITQSGRQTQLACGHDEGLSLRRFRCQQSAAKKVVDHRFKRGPRAAHLLSQEAG